MAMTFALPAGAAEPREPYEPEPPAWTDSPESDLRDQVGDIGRQLDKLFKRFNRGIGCEDADYRVVLADLASIERAATALNTATAIYRARRAA